MSKFKLEVIENISISKEVEIVSKYALTEEEIDGICNRLDKCEDNKEWNRLFRSFGCEIRRVVATGKNEQSIKVESIELLEGETKKSS